jgi:UDP-N-acetylglucosamine 2-epimerase (non-hydrolysing)
MRKYKIIKPVLIHTGQHYDYQLSQVFFQDLKIPKPDYNLNIGSGTHGEQVGRGIIEVEKVIIKEKPDLVLVVGDANACLVGALASVKLHIPVCHVEAGLRSFDRRMPEEINRLLADHISNLLFVTEPRGIKNLIHEGISRKKIFYVGNVMIDTLIRSKAKSQNLKVYERFDLEKKEYAVLTLHRSENIDDGKILAEIMRTLGRIQEKIKIIWPIHPHAKKQIRKFNLKGLGKNLKTINPLGYLEMLNLIQNAKFVLTDSGGIQEETTFLKIPCLTLRENTERPITEEIGTNIVCGRDQGKIMEEVEKILNNKAKKGIIPRYWDGRASERIIKIILRKHKKDEKRR